MHSLIPPDISHKSRYLDMIEEWKNFETIPTSPANLFMGDTFEEFLLLCASKLFFWKGSVPSDLLLFFDSDILLWAIDIRHSLDHPAIQLSWHIGYGLRPSARGRWLAREMLRLGLIEAAKLGIKEIMISADEDNPASWKTIEFCGWVYSKTIMKDGKPLKIYWAQI